MADWPILQQLKLRNRRFIVFTIQVLFIVVGYVLAFNLRFDFQIPDDAYERMVQTLPVLLFLRLIANSIWKLNTGWWRLVAFQDLVNIARATTLGSVLFILLLVFGLGVIGYGFPRSVLIIEPVFHLLLMGGARFSVRWFRERDNSITSKQRQYVIIIGAGNAGTQLLREIRLNPALGIKVVGFVDDDKTKQNVHIHGVRVMGTCEQAANLAQRYDVDEVLIAIPSAGYKRVSLLIKHLQNAGISVRSLPSISQMIRERGLWAQLKNVSYEDLLTRPKVQFKRASDLLLLQKEVQDKIILITGAAGSIGSELARQVADLKPRQLILYERGETPLYYLELELRRKFPDCEIIPVVADILDKQRLDLCLSTYQVDLIYHTAAYKHVPMMEREPYEAFQNNILGTETIAIAACEHKVAKVIYISTDKAVNPTNIMGGTKRIGELIMQARNSAPTKFIAVRFGNVIGSSGSVVPLFKKQIEDGGPVTITDPEVTRYFMLISEAVQLVMTAGALGKGGEIFLLDMGNPVKISELADRLIKASGLAPGKDIDVKYVGLRPGEKLHEELYWQGENVVPTENKKITQLKTSPIDPEMVFSQLTYLKQANLSNIEQRLFEVFLKLIGEGEFQRLKVNGNASQSREVSPRRESEDAVHSQAE